MQRQGIERELLAIVFACQRFSTYLLGRSFMAESDHKLLEMIAMKNLANAPPNLQRMLLELQRYDVTIKTRTTDATGRRFKPLPSKSLTGNQTRHASRLHCLDEAMDSETQGQHSERPHPRNIVSAHPAGLAASAKTRATFSEEILGL